MSDFISQFDEALYTYLNNNADNMPSRFIKFLAYYYPDARIRKIYLNKLGVVIGENSYTNLGFQCVLMDNGISAVIGNNVSIAPNVVLICNSSANNGDELVKLAYVRDNLIKSGQIIIEDDAWICANVTIFPGVKVGKCTIIGAGSVLLEDATPYSIYAGSPAKRIRDLNTGDRVKG